MTGHPGDGPVPAGPAGLYTDLYELRMVESYLRSGMTAPATFSLFVRPSPARPWLVAAGTHRVCELLTSFRYGPPELDYLRGLEMTRESLAWLRDLQLSGEIVAVPDGTIVLGDEPLLEVTAPLPFAQLIETAVINLVQLPTLVATKAARIALAAAGRSVADFGFRRAHGLQTGIEAALWAYVGGGVTTSNVEAGRRYGIPVTGTMAHSFVQAFGDELAAFRAFVRDHPDSAVLLVDTYDTLRGVVNAIVVADELSRTGHRLKGVRLDSGDIGNLAFKTRAMLDEAGHHDVAIIASGGLDERSITRLVASKAPVDSFGVGTSLVVSQDAPALDIVYKLVAYNGEPRAKFSEHKATLPGPKQIFRREGPGTDVLGRRDERLPGTPLLEPLWRDGKTLRSFDLTRARATAADGLQRLADAWPITEDVDPPPRPAVSPALQRLADEVRKRWSAHRTPR